jgi:hypothetical protein
LQNLEDEGLEEGFEARGARVKRACWVCRRREEKKEEKEEKKQEILANERCKACECNTVTFHAYPLSSRQRGPPPVACAAVRLRLIRQ